MPRIRILVADDYTAFRKCLFSRLNAEPDMEVIAKVANGADAVSLAKALLPDLAIIDVSMPQLNGIEASRQLHSDCPATRIMLTSAYDSERCWATLLHPGATKYLLKICSLSDVIDAVRLAFNCQGLFDPEPTNAGLCCVVYRPTGESTTEWLQPRELEVLKLVAKGMSNKDIAEELIVSDRTVEAHLYSAYRKLKVSSRTQAMLCALKRGWLSLYDFADAV